MASSPTRPLSLLLLACGCAVRTPELLEPDVPPAPAAPLTVQDLQPPHPPVGGVALPASAQVLLSLARDAEQQTYGRLVSLCDDVGHRLAGSPGLEAAVKWGEAGFRADEQEGIAAEPVPVPVWTRGEESLSVVLPRTQRIAMLGLGNSVGTGDAPVEADVVVATSFDELGPHVAGKVVLYDVPMGTTPPMIKHYGDNVGFRTRGPSQAARHGAVATLVRSVTTRSLYTPHTGATFYDPAAENIPAAAITPEDAGWIHRLVEGGTPVRVRLEMGAEMADDEGLSHNVLAEVLGSEHPEEIVLIGAHLDSWDVGQGAHDDGAGVVEVMEALRLIRELEQAPRRTVRAVLFTNEENGLRGGKAYAAAHGGEVHVAAIESDLGGGWPISWGASGTDAQLAWLREAAGPLGMPVAKGGGGADISPLKASGVLRIGLRPDDTHYFDFHHTPADTVDKVDPAALAEATGALAVLAWQLANAENAPAPQPAAPAAPAP